MRLTDQDLRQIDEAYLDGLSPEALREISKRLCHNLKEARERLNQTPQTAPARSKQRYKAMTLVMATGYM